MFPLPHTPDSLWSFSAFHPACSSLQGCFYANTLKKSLVEYVLSVKLRLVMVKSSFIIYVTEVVVIPMEILMLHFKQNEYGKVLRL